MYDLESPLAVVDLETTGSQPASDRITGIGVIEVDGFEESSEWSTLVNPGTAIPAPSQALTGLTCEMVGSEWATVLNPGPAIPAPIHALTGITCEMVARAPSFAELPAGLYERLAGRGFVAHNARLDYGFLRPRFRGG